MVEPLGDRTLITTRAGDDLIKVDLPGAHPYAVDQPVRLGVPRDHLHFFAADGERVTAGSVAAA
jgi:ABC-type sugar transport system ATPase subunit